MLLGVAVRGLEPHVSLRGKLAKKSHGFINLSTKSTDVGLTVRSPMTRVPTRFGVRLSGHPPKFGQRAV